jgi:hypothetical protein
MALIELWESSPQTVAQFTIEQIVKISGDGNILDDSTCSQELKEYLAKLPDSEKIRAYVEQCLSFSFHRSGMALQDLVNELGRRLEYTVINGRYGGTPNKIGFDGIWKSPEGHTIVVEVKTSDAYRVALATIASYREKLKATNAITPKSSILIVVGRQDTGELESQVRGSRHAWDIRLISAEALGKLVQLKENAEGPEIGQRIRSLLVPMEYTRLDEMVEVMFTTAKGTAEAVTEVVAPEGEGQLTDQPTGKSGKASQFTDNETLRVLRDKIIATLGIDQSTTFLKKSSALHWNAQHDKRVACTLSKRYEQKGPGGYSFWYGYHQTWDEFLAEGSSSLIALGCVGTSFAFAVPWTKLHPLLSALDSTTKPADKYWHVRVSETTPGHFALLLPGGSGTFPLDAHKISLP